MHNLIMNSHFKTGSDHEPTFFINKNVTYDLPYINNYRTCSITQTIGKHGFEEYNIPIPIYGGNNIKWGYMIRAIDKCRILLQACFYNNENTLIDKQQFDIACLVNSNFSRQMVKFKAPCNAQSVKLSILFEGDTTACTFYAPLAYYC
jgi:hypothetical protein